METEGERLKFETLITKIRTTNNKCELLDQDHNSHILCKFIARNQVLSLLIKPHALPETTKFSVMLFFSMALDYGVPNSV